MELKILHWFEELHNPVLDFLMYQITCLGNGGLIWLVIALLGCLPLVPWLREKWRLLSRPCWAAALESGAGMAWNLVLLFFCTAFLAGQSYNPFLYFRF